MSIQFSCYHYLKLINFSKIQAIFLYNRFTPELKIFWVFPANPWVGTINALINGKYFKHVANSFLNVNAS